jgi:8-oxo-dGTP pyrophosphatase MutT (NUDIX family)
VFPGGAVDADEGDDEAAHKAAAVRELAEEAGIEVPIEELIPYSRWITPRVMPIRFDTRFYLALAPAHSPPKPDGSETVDADWFEPARALQMHEAGELALVFPTIKHLESLVEFRNAEEALEAARGRVVEPFEPQFSADELPDEVSKIVPPEKQ